MITCQRAPARKTTRPRTEVLPPVPDRRHWKTDEARAFEAAVRWFLAVSRNADSPGRVLPAAGRFA